MNRQEIDKLHELAVGQYVEGRYEEARKVWEEILRADPGEPRAVEGVQLVNALAAPDAPSRSGSRADLAASLHSVDPELEIPRIEGLLGAAQYRAALGAARALEASFPDNPAVKALVRSALERVEAEPFIDGELAQAQRSLANDDRDGAFESCLRILALDAGHAGALELLRNAGGKPEVPPAAPIADPVRPDSIRVTAAPIEESFDVDPEDAEDLTEEIIEDLSGMKSAAESGHAGALFEPPAEAIPIGPARAAGLDPPAAPAPAQAGALDSPARPAASPPATPAAPAPPPAPGGSEGEDFFSQFADLEAEIGEELNKGVGATPEPARQAAPPSPVPASQQGQAQAPVVEPAIPDRVAGSPSEDLAFDDDFTSFPDESAPKDRWGELSAAAAAETGASARVAALLDEARRFLQTGKLSEAIESAARAAAIDPESTAAQELIEEARRKKHDAENQMEERLAEARGCFETGDLESAEVNFRAVLRAYPAHAEAIEGLEKIARRRSELRAAVAPAESFRGSETPPPPAPRPALAKTGTAPVETEAPNEPLTPKSRAAETRAEAARPAPAPPHTQVRPAKEASPPARRLGRVVAIGAGAVVLALIVIAGVLLTGKVTSGKLAPELSKRTASEVAPKPAGSKGMAPKVGASKAPAPSAAKAPKPPELAVGYPRTLPAAKQLASEGKLQEARAVLFDIIRQQPGNTQAASMLESVEARIQERVRQDLALSQIRADFTHERYEDALRQLYRLPAEMQKGDIEMYKANAWYNDGVLYLSGGNCTEAIRCLNEVLAINPRDNPARDLRDFAQGYLGREKDTAYLRLLDTLGKRSMDAR